MPQTPIEVGLAVLELARAGGFDEIRERFAPPLLPLVNADALRAAWTGAIDQVGPIASVGTPASEAGPGGTVVKIPVQGERGALTFVVSVADGGQLTGLQLAPPEAMDAVAPWDPPAYADPSQFDEEELTLGSEPLSVPATLSVPRRAGRLPAVVLLAGSGPLDRDETVGPNKPFRDLAWGLASRGVVVLRFDKVTLARRAEVLANPHFTMTDEYLPQALAAIALLREHPAVDPGRLFVAGHSLGGTVAPRVAAAAPDVAGLVILGGGAAPLHWVIVRQLRYIASLDPSTAAAAEPGIEAISRQAERVDDPDLSPDTPASEMPLGTPAPYWLDLRDYDAAAAAAALGKPILLLQGGRDYQATVDDDLVRWKAALDGQPGTTVRIFAADDHFFFPGTGPSGPQGSMAPGQHVDPEVIDEIVGWLESRQLRA